MTREEKESSVAELREVIDRSTGMYFTDFEGMTVEQTTRLRNELRKAGLTFKVGKNTLIRRALDDAGRLTDNLRAALVRQTGVAFGFDDPVAPARILRDFIEKNQDKPVLKLAYVEGQTFPGTDLKKVAALPTKKEVILEHFRQLRSSDAGYRRRTGRIAARYRLSRRCDRKEESRRRRVNP